MKTINVGEVAVFDHVEPNKEQALKPLEEAAEVFGAWQEWEETKSLSDEGRVIEEIADTIQACVNLAAAMGVGGLAYAMMKCKIRNIERGRITKENPEALDADGVPIELGDKLYFADGNGTPLKCVGFSNDGLVKITLWESYEDWEPHETRTVANELTHKKPDSWEQLEKDMSAGAYDYCATLLDIDTRKTLTSEDNEAFAEDIIRRAKALAGVDDE